MHVSFPAPPAFTLAEVLIVLGIIGLIADMTIPTLIVEKDKKIAVTRVQKFYSVMSQALQMSEIENGPISDWDFPKSSTSQDDTADWFKKYLQPYLLNTTITKVPLEEGKTSDANIIFMNDGSSFTIHIGSCIDFFYDVNGPLKGKNKDGYDKFGFIACVDHHSCDNYKNSFSTYLCGAPKNYTRDFILNNSYHGCNKNSTTKAYCAALIQYDGWKISDDYPW